MVNEEIEHKKITVALSNEDIKIHNLIVDYKNNFNLFVIGQKGQISKLVKKCTSVMEGNLDMSSCENFVDGSIKHFFYKEGNYVLIDGENTLKMCNYFSDHYDQGKLKENWPIKSLMLEGQLLILVIENKKLDKNIVFQYNFLKKWFNWYTAKFGNFHHLRLFKGEPNLASDKYLIANFLENKGYQIYDITFNPNMVVSA